MQSLKRFLYSAPNFGSLGPKDPHCSAILISPSLQGTVVDKFCCSASADVSKCQGNDKWKYAGMVVKDKVCISFKIFLES